MTGCLMTYSHGAAPSFEGFCRRRPAACAQSLTYRYPPDRHLVTTSNGVVAQVQVGRLELSRGLQLAGPIKRRARRWPGGRLAFLAASPISKTRYSGRQDRAYAKVQDLRYSDPSADEDLPELRCPDRR